MFHRTEGEKKSQTWKTDINLRIKILCALHFK